MLNGVPICPPYYCHIERTTAQALVANTPTIVQFNSNPYFDGITFNPLTFDISIPFDGLYDISSFFSVTAGTTFGYIRKNGNLIVFSGSTTVGNVTGCILPLLAGDTIGLTITSTVNSNVNFGSTFLNTFLNVTYKRDL